MFKNIFDIFNSFWSKIRKNGFTLAEALIVTVMTGYCLLPILGTMQNAQSKTQEYDHQSKMQLYTRSRLTEEIANAAFDQTSVNTTPEYHYIVYLDKGSASKEGKESNAELIELGKTSIEPEEFKKLLDNDEWKESAALDLIGKGKDENGKPYVNIIHIYKTTVEINNSPKLATFTSDLTEKPFDSPKALLGIIVKTCLYESNGENYNETNGCLQILKPKEDPSDKDAYIDDPSTQVLPYTLFSFVNLPVVTDEMIWLVDAANYKVYGVDPISRGVNSIQLPDKISGTDKADDCKPWFIAVHPSLKILACASKKYLYLINIDKKSNNYGKYKYLNFSYHLHKEGGIAFRPDGKYLFISPLHIDEKDAEPKIDTYNLIVYKVLYNIDNTDPNNLKLIWKPDDSESPEPKFELIDTKGSLVKIDKDNKIVGFLPANDGYLYVAYNNKAIGVTRYPMYCSDIEGNKNSWASETIVSNREKTSEESKEDYDNDENNLTHDIISIDVSPDGSRLAIIADKDLYLYDTHTGVKLISKTLTEITDLAEVTDFEPNRVSFSALSYSTQEKIYDDKNLIFTVTNKLKDKSNVAYVFYYDTNSNPKDIKSLRIINKSGNKGGNLAINTPDNLSVVMTDQEKKQIYFGTVGKININEEITETNGNLSTISNTDEKVGIPVDISTNNRDTLAVASTDKIKLYDINTFKEIEDVELTATDTITSLAFNPQGNMLLTGFGSGIGAGGKAFSFFNLNDLSKIDKGSGYGKRITFDDRIPNMAFTLEYPVSTGDNQNAFWNIDTTANEVDDPNWAGAESPYLRRKLKLHSDWERLDMIGMPNGGALALYGKSDGSSMLEWIGRRNWKDDSNREKYKLFARWTNLPEKADYPLQNKPYPYLANSINKNTYDGCDGTVIIGRYSLPQGKAYKFMSVKTGNWGATKRSITPLIIKYSISLDCNYKVIDYAESFELKAKQFYRDLPLKWANGGNITSNCYIGFWHGSITSGYNGGVVDYDFDTTNNFYYSDCYRWTSAVTKKSEFYNFSQLSNGFDDHSRYGEGNGKRNYAIQFNYVPSKPISNFPPLFSKKLAISPDCGTLAILKGDSSATNNEDKKPVINLYDFNNQIYGPETQLEGMLVDYREDFDSGAEANGYTPVRGWPNETVSIFKKVIPYAHFSSNTDSSGGLTSFASATTKYDSWSSFNDYPANYWFINSNEPNSSTDPINNAKSTSNKRFFGYYRPETNKAYLQRFGADEPRFFLNNNIIGGKTEQFGGEQPLANPIELYIKAYSSSLLQIDEASNKGGMFAGIFISYPSKDISTFDYTWLSANTNSSDRTKQNYTIKTEHLDKIDYLTSSETYILYNKPSFIGSFTAQTGPSDSLVPLNINATSMLFSRDRAKPVLYINDDNYLWLLYLNSLIRIKSIANISSNIALSTDGQKLIYGNNESGPHISAVNISKPDKSKFLNNYPMGAIKIKELETSEFSNSYINPITPISNLKLDTTPIYLATKPYASYKSSNAGGEYNSLGTVSGFKISSNAAAIASGGIYLIGSGTKAVAFYNPLTTYNIINHNDVLKKEANSVAVTAYNDIIYAFGNAKVGSDNLSGRVQSYDVNSKKSLVSGNQSMFTDPLDNYHDSYQVNLSAIDASTESGASNFTDSMSNYFSGINVLNSYHAFTLQTTAWAYSKGETWSPPMDEASISIFNTIPLSVNKIMISNYNPYNYDNFSSLDKFELQYLEEDEASYNSLGEFTIGTAHASKSDKAEFEFGTEGDTYKSKEFKLILKTFLNTKTDFADKNVKSGSNTDRTAVSLIQLWRTGVKRLTPVKTDLGSSYDGKMTFTWTNPKLSGNVTITGSSRSSDGSKYLSDIFSKNGCNENNIVTGSDGWENQNGTDKNPWIKISLEIPEEVCAVRFAQDSSVGMIKTLEFYGTNDDTVANADSLNLSNWNKINFSDDNPSFSVPKVNGTFITAELKPTTRYKHYLFYEKELVNENDKMRLIGFELFAKKSTLDGDSVSDNDYLTPMKDDDLSEIKASNGAACATPYGLVYSGGLDSSGSATQTSLLYWPHAINKYDGNYYQYGISRSLPDMKVARANHALVWHKGKIYAIGGRANSSNADISGDFIEVLDYNKEMEWKTYSKPYKYVDGASSSHISYRYNLGACSFSDEIFIFAGEDNDSEPHTSAIAFNPETGVVRKLTDMCEGLGDGKYLTSCVAVPYGSKIYIFGNDKASPNTLKILEYTP